MIISPLSALNGLGSMLGAADGVAGVAGALSNAAGAAGVVSPGSFANMLGEKATDTIEGMRGAEKLSLDALQGKAETREVVSAIMSAEQSLQAAIAIRDKIVSSYLEVSRMAI